MYFIVLIIDGVVVHHVKLEDLFVILDQCVGILACIVLRQMSVVVQVDFQWMTGGSDVQVADGRGVQGLDQAVLELLDHRLLFEEDFLLLFDQVVLVLDHDGFRGRLEVLLVGRLGLRH